MKRFIAIFIMALLGMSCVFAQTMTITIEGKEVKNGDNIVVNKAVTETVLNPALKMYDLGVDVKFKTLIAQTVETEGVDLDQVSPGLACCPTGFTCTTANASNGWISSGSMSNLAAGREVNGVWIHYNYGANKKPADGTVRKSKITFKGAMETITFNLTVNTNVSSTDIVASSITLNSSYESMLVGNTVQLLATVLPNDIPNKSVIWSSANKSIADVNQYGIVTANSVGETTITATTTDSSNLSASCKIKVIPILATGIILDKTTAKINVGSSSSISASILPETATYKTVAWKSSDKTVVTVTNGVIAGKNPGTAIISASTTDGSNLSASCTVTVLNILATMLSLDKESIDLYVDETAPLKAAIYPYNTTTQTVTWTSSNATVATVVEGVVTAQSEGTATIAAKTTDGSNLSAACQITVKRYPQNIIWNQDLSTVVSGGELIKLEATSSSGLDVTFSSSDDNIASIFVLSDGAYLNAYGEGVVNIMASQGGDNHYAPSSQLKVVNVVASSGITDVYSDEHFTIYTLKGVKVGIFTAEEYKKLMLAKGVYIVNGKKMIVK